MEINNWSIPLTNKYFILTYEGEVNLGVDLDQADIQVTQNKIKIALPPVEVLTNTIDEKSIEVYNESKNVFNQISINDYKEFAIQQKKLVDEELKEKQIYQVAEENTINSITKLLQIADGIKDQYDIEVTFKN